MRRGMRSAAVKRWKGFEREVARELRELAPSARRCLQYQRQHGAPDVAAGVLWVECKSGKHRAIESIYLDTATKARVRKGAVPAVVSKAGPRGPRLVTLALEDFIRIAGAPEAARVELWRGQP